MSLLRAVILDIAANSDIASYSWKGRGVAPAGYIKGMALVYARVYCRLKLNDPAVVEMAKPVAGDAAHDALAWYSHEFTAAGMHNNTQVNRLRHLFVLLIGEGMRESGGRYCDGQGGNTTAETAEAGLFQTSYNARTANSMMPIVFNRYRVMPFGFLDVFKGGVACSAADLKNYGSGDGAEFQRLSKACPAFAAEFAAIGFRNRRKHWGPLNNKTAEVRRECDAMLSQVQAVVDTFLDDGGLLGSVGAYAQLIF